MLRKIKFTDTGNIEILDERGVAVAMSKNNMLIIFEFTRLYTAIEIAEKYGHDFVSVWYGDYPVWFPSIEDTADWAR